MTQIRLAKLYDSDAISQLLNEVTLNLHNKGINQWAYPWDYNEIKSDIEKGHINVLIKDDLIVGTFSLKELNDSSFPGFEANSFYLYRIAILPQYQGRNLGLEVVDYACQISRDMKKLLFLDCWAGNIKLRDFYSAGGFTHIGDFPEEDYMISVFKY